VSRTPEGQKRLRHAAGGLPFCFSKGVTKHSLEKELRLSFEQFNFSEVSL
jgi:hypothetical protein